jgi:outer membrane protein assembly factor BamB
MRYGMVLLALATLSAVASAQRSAPPPDREALERLNLKTEWTSYLPLQGGKDSIASVQVIDDAQIFVQTKSGLLVAIDAVTGAKQWAYRYPSEYVNIYPVGVNDDFVFAVNVARLLAFSRTSGVLQFDFELSGSATAGPVADKELIYVTINGTKLAAYAFPQVLMAQEKAKPGDTRKPVNAADAVAQRVGSREGFSTLKDPEFTKLTYPAEAKKDIGLGPKQYTPSIAGLPSITPPYTLDNRGLYITPAITMLPSLRQPYQLKPDYMQYNQRTPSVQSLPPSVAQAALLANFRPKGIAPELRWNHVSGRRYMNQPVLTDSFGVTNRNKAQAVSRLWVATDGKTIEAIDKKSNRIQVEAVLQDVVVSQMSGPVEIAPGRTAGFVGLVDGNVVALNLLLGSEVGPRIEWRTSIGGYMNHKPLATKDAVFASGEQSGTAKIDLDTGELIWKSENIADRVLAVNEEFVYIRDRMGNLAIYDRHRATDAVSRRSTPLTKLDVAAFNVPVTNEKNDRLLLAADSGALVCLRDANPKYAKPVHLVPVIEKKEVAPPAPMEEPKKDEPKKEEPKKADVKKDEPKKDEPKKN